MRKLNYAMMITAMLCGIAATIVALYKGSNWTWQFGTSIWAFIAYTSERRIARMESEMKETSDQIKEYLKNKK